MRRLLPAASVKAARVLMICVLVWLAACRPVASPGESTLVVSSTAATAPPALQTPTALAPTVNSTPAATATPFVPLPGTSTPLPTTIPTDVPFAIHFDPWELVNAVAWSPDGDILAAAAGENLLLYQAQHLKALRSIHLGAFTHGLTFSPKGDRLAAASRDGLVRIWAMPDLLTEAGAMSSITIEAHGKGANSVAFSPDGRWLASGGNDAVVRVWNADTGERVQQVIGGTYAVPSVAFSPDGGVLAIANGPLIRLREVEGGRILGTLRAESASLYSMAYSPDGRWMAAGDNDNNLWVWNAAAAGGKDSPAPQQWRGHQGRAGSPAALVWQVAFSPKSTQGALLLASAGGDGVVRLWDGATGEPAGVLEGHTAAVTGLAFSPDGLWLATSSLDGDLRVWELP